jgi:hypothetical protein
MNQQHSVVNLAFRKLQHVDLDTLAHNKQAVILSYNNLRTITIDTANDAVEYLDLSHNQLTEISKDFLQKLPKLRVLKLQGNYLTSLPANMHTLDNLTELWIGDCLGGNCISALPPLPPSLRVLMARDNKLLTIQESYPNIEIVDVSNNKLTRLPDMEGSRVFRASGNRITGVRRLDAFKRLELLDVTGNNLVRRVGGGGGGGGEVRPGLIILQDHGNDRIHDITTTSSGTVVDGLLRLCIEACFEEHMCLPGHLYHRNHMA